MFYFDEFNILCEVDLDGSTEYASKTTTVNLDLNDTNRVTSVYDVEIINADFELADIVADDVTSDITGWTGCASGKLHYSSDWNTV